MASFTGLKINTNITNVKAEFDTLLKYINTNLSKPFNIQFNLQKIDSQINQVIAKTKELSSSKGININAKDSGFGQLENNIKKTSQSLKEGTESAHGFSESLAGATQKFATWLLLGNAVVSTIHFFTDGIRYTKELNDQLTQISIVTGKSQADLQKYLSDYTNLAQQMSVSTQDVASAAVEFYRQGLNQADVMERLKTTTEYAKISNLGFQESAEILTATVNSMGVSIERASDVFAYLGDATATGADEIGKAFQRVGGTAAALNVNFEKTASWIAVVSSKTRESAESIGNGIKSIMARYSQLREKGFTEDDGTKVNNVAKALASAGITMMDAQGQFRDFGTVMDELGGKWNGLDSRTKAYISTQLAGTYQMSRFQNLMNGYSDSVDLYNKSLEATGTTQQKYNLWLQGTEAHLNQLKLAGTNIWQQVFKSEDLQIAIDMLTNVVKGVGSLMSIFGGLPTIVGAASFAFLMLNKSFSAETIQRYMSAIIMLPQAYTEAKAEGIGLSATLEALGVGFDIAKIKAIAFQATVSLGLSLVITAAVAGITKLISSQKSASEQMSNLKSEMDNLNSGESLIKKYDNLESQLKTLDKSSQDYKTTQDQLIQVQQQLAKQFPNLVDGYDKENNAIIRNIDSVKKYNDEQKKQIMAKANSVYNENLNELQKKKSNFGFGSVVSSTNASDIEKYNRLIEGRNSALNSGEVEAAGNYAKEIDELSKKFKDFNEASVQLYEIGKTDVMYFDEASGKLIKYSDYLDKNTKAKANNASASDKMSSQNKDSAKSADDASNSIKDLSAIESDLAKAAKDAKGDIDKVNETLQKHQKTGEWDLNTIYELAANGYPQLLDKMNDDKALQEELINITKDKVSAVTSSLNEQIKFQANYVNQLLVAYNYDVTAFKTAEEAKNAIAKTGINQRIAMYNQEADSYSRLADSLSGVDQDNALRGAMRSGDLASIERAKMVSASTAIDTYFSMKQLSANVSGSLGNIGSSGYDGKKNGTDKSAEDAAKKAEQAVQDAYSAISDIDDKLQAEIKREVDLERKALDERLKMQKEFIDEKMKALDDQYTKEDRKRKLDEENKKKADLEAKKAELMNDTSQEAQARKYDLQQQIDAQQTTIEGLNRDYTREDQKANLQKQQDDYEKAIQKQKDALDAKYSDAEVAKMASSGLKGALVTIGDQSKTAKQMLLDAMTASGEAFTSAGAKLQTDIIDKLIQVQTLVKSMNSDGTISGNVALNVLGSHANGAKINQEGLYHLHQDEWVVNRKQGNILDDLVKGNINSVQQYKIPPTPQIASGTNGNSNITVNFDSLIGNIQGNVGQTELSQIRDIVKTEIPKIVNDYQRNNSKRLGDYNPNTRNVR